MSSLLGGPVQIAYAVEDVVAAAHRWADRGVGPFFVREHIEVRRSRVWGERAAFDHSSAYGQWGDVMVELICQHSPGIRPLVGTSGVHHIASFVDNFGGGATELIGAGLDEALYAETADGMPFSFFDARAERGHFIEIYERTGRLDRFYRLVSDAADGWTGADPVRML